MRTTIPISGRRSLGELKADDQPAPTVDGVPLEDGYGVAIEWDEEEQDRIDLLYPALLPRPPRLVAWMTLRDARGEYQKVRQLHPRAVVEFDAEGKHVWFCEGIGRITTTRRMSELEQIAPRLAAAYRAEQEYQRRKLATYGTGMVAMDIALEEMVRSIRTIGRAYRAHLLSLRKRVG